MNTSRVSSSFYSSAQLFKIYMQLRRVSGIIGKFLQIYAVLTLVPVVVAVIYSEPLINIILFVFSGAITLVTGTLLVITGNAEEPSVQEAIFSTVFGWVLAVLIGAIPLTHYMIPLDAVFESMAGLTTTGISLLLEPSRLPHSMLFWRSFMQWIGGLGILTFFIAVIRESGGISQRLFSAEAHKTDPGSIRPSLMKSIIDLWRVYGFITTLMIGIYMALGMDGFNAVIHSFSGLSTGGFSSSSASMAAFNTAIQTVTVLFMFVGGVNFVLLYMVLRGDIKPFFKNSEFKLYTGIFLLATALTGYGLISQMGVQQAVLNASFQAAAVISSTGYSIMSITDLSVPLQIFFLALMFVGGSLGSTAGGLKVFRLLTMFKLLKTRLRSYTLPKTAVNKVKIDGEILRDDSVKTISVLLFTWVAVTFTSGMAIVAMDGVSFLGGLSAAVSAAGNMGPVFFSGQELVNLSIGSKLVLIIGMLAGRLEMLPLLALLNKKI
mgnify:FL=1